MMMPGSNGFSDPTKLKEQITLVPLNVYSSESDDSDMDHNGIPDIDPGQFTLFFHVKFYFYSQFSLSFAFTLCFSV